MLCPRCKSNLIQAPDTRLYQTLIEHAEDDPVYEKSYMMCSNQKCDVNHLGFWDMDGDFYPLLPEMSYEEVKELIALDCIAKRLDTEIRKHGEDRIILHLGFIKWKLVCQYKADNFGNIIKRTRRIEVHIRIHGSWIIKSSLFYCLALDYEMFKMTLRRYKEFPGNKNIRMELLEYFKKGHSFSSYIFSWWINQKYSAIKKSIILENIFEK